MTSALTRPKRRDAEANRDHVLETARASFAADGLDVSLAEVARRSGVGIATLFRNFPRKADLVSAVYAQPLELCAIALERSLEDEEHPWQVLAGAMRDIGALQARDRGFAAVLLDVLEQDPRFSSARVSMETSMRRLIGRAIEVDAVRPDLEIADIALLLHANAGIIAHARGDATDISARLVSALLRSFQRDGWSPAGCSASGPS